MQQAMVRPRTIQQSMLQTELLAAAMITVIENASWSGEQCASFLQQALELIGNTEILPEPQVLIPKVRA